MASQTEIDRQKAKIQGDISSPCTTRSCPSLFASIRQAHEAVTLWNITDYQAEKLAAQKSLRAVEGRVS
jgi:hypothetical protein